MIFNIQKMDLEWLWLLGQYLYITPVAQMLYVIADAMPKMQQGKTMSHSEAVVLNHYKHNCCRMITWSASREYVYTYINICGNT